MDANNNNNAINKRFIPVANWSQFHSWPPLGGLRHLIFHEKENGFDECIVRAGRRVLINEQAFFSWLEAQKKGGAK